MISHLCYANDMIMFCNGSIVSIRKHMEFLDKYKNFSGQETNKLKYCLVTGKKQSDRDTLIKSIIGFPKKELPMIYLGCPLYKGGGMSCLFSSVLDKIHSRLAGWKGKLLSFGANILLIKAVLLAMPLYYMSLLIPTKRVMFRMETIISNFLWND